MTEAKNVYKQPPNTLARLPVHRGAKPEVKPEVKPEAKPVVPTTPSKGE